MTSTLRPTIGSVAALVLLVGAASAAAQDVPQRDGARGVTVSIKVPPLGTKSCQATLSTRSEQRNTVARVEGTIEIADCVACSGDYTIVLRVRDETGETKSLEFVGSWQRADDRPVKFTTDYPIGDNVDLLNVRTRGLRCVCAAAPAEAAAPGGDAAPRADAAARSAAPDKE